MGSSLVVGMRGKHVSYAEMSSLGGLTAGESAGRFLAKGLLKWREVSRGSKIVAGDSGGTGTVADVEDASVADVEGASVADVEGANEEDVEEANVADVEEAKEDVGEVGVEEDQVEEVEEEEVEVGGDMEDDRSDAEEGKLVLQPENWPPWSGPELFSVLMSLLLLLLLILLLLILLSLLLLLL